MDKQTLIRAAAEHEKRSRLGQRKIDAVRKGGIWERIHQRMKETGDPRLLPDSYDSEALFLVKEMEVTLAQMGRWVNEGGTAELLYGCIVNFLACARGRNSTTRARIVDEASGLLAVAGEYGVIVAAWLRDGPAWNVLQEIFRQYLGTTRERRDGWLANMRAEGYSYTCLENMLKSRIKRQQESGLPKSEVWKPIGAKGIRKAVGATPVKPLNPNAERDQWLYARHGEVGSLRKCVILLDEEVNRQVEAGWPQDSIWNPIDSPQGISLAIERHRQLLVDGS